MLGFRYENDQAAEHFNSPRTSSGGGGGLLKCSAVRSFSEQKLNIIVYFHTCHIFLKHI
jgi:hypothetical protein